MRMKGKPTINACLDSQLERESTWKIKASTAVKCHILIAPIVENSKNRKQTLTFTSKQTVNTANKLQKKTIHEDDKQKWDTRVRPCKETSQTY